MTHYKPYPAYKDSGVDWLGRVPEHWELKRVRHISIIDNSGCYGEDELSGRASLALKTCTTAHITTGGQFLFDEMPEKYFSREEVLRYSGQTGDLFVVKSSGSNTNIISGKLARVRAENDQIIFTNFLLRIRSVVDRVLPELLEHFLGSSITRRRIERMVASTTYPNINVEEYVSAFVPIPPMSEQKVIAAHLDRETARIDALVAKKTRFIELLSEKRQALITHAVTKGLDPNVKMKDSGVKWLGEVPEHWELAPLKRLISSIGQGWSPECEARTPDSGEWGVVKVGCVNGGVFRPEESKALPAEMEARPEPGLRKGDVLVSRANTRELVGSCAVVPKDYPYLLLCDKLYRIGCGARVTPDFLAALITVYGRRAVEIEATGASSSMVNIAQSVILDLFVAIPSKQEQDVIMDRISVTTARIESLCAKTERSIELLKERRSALITAAVTGQIDLREAV